MMIQAASFIIEIIKMFMTSRSGCINRKQLLLLLEKFLFACGCSSFIICQIGKCVFVASQILVKKWRIQKVSH